MKIVYLWSYYDHYLTSFYKRFPDFTNMSYSQQYDMLLDDYFGVPGSYTRWTNKLGHEATLIINNCEPLQRSWAKENNIAFTDNWQRDIAIEQVKKIRPDIFLMGSMFNLYGTFLDEIKKYVGTTMGWIACPIPDHVSLNQMSLILTSHSSFVDGFRKNGINSELLLPAFDPEILKKFPHNIKQDVTTSFIGGISADHGKRYLFLNEIAKNITLKVWGYGVKQTGIRHLIHNLINKPPLAKNYMGEVWGMDMYQILRRSKITLNSHIDVAGNQAGNMRMFEATGIGTLLLTDNMSNLSDIFIPGKEVVAYDSAADAVDKIMYYLGHEEERNKIAMAGQNRTLTDYSYDNNSKKMLNYFEQYS